jgi:hypothetical protein
MPPKKQSNKGGSKKTGKSAKSYESSKAIRQDMENPTRWPAPVVVRFPGIGFPDRLRMRVKYTQVVSFSSAVSPAAQVWNLNSIYQVDATGSTGNPSFYNAIGTIYKRYVVMGLEGFIDVTGWAPTAAGSGSSVSWGFQLSDNNTGSKTVLQMIESKYVIHGLLPPVIGAATLSDVATLPQRKKIPYTNMGMINGQKVIENDPNFYTGIGANPTDIVFGVFRTVSDDGVTNVTGKVRLTIVQDVIFKDIVDVIS